MIKLTRTYIDYNGMTRTEDFWFNLTQAELIEMEYSSADGLSNMIDRLIAASDTPEIIRAFKKLVLKAYGEKSADGRRFKKGPEIEQEFSEMPVYSDIFMELATNAKLAAEFINGILPELTPEQKAKLEEAKVDTLIK